MVAVRAVLVIGVVLVPSGSARAESAGARLPVVIRIRRPAESTTTAQKVPSDETLTVRFLDVGQGDSILLSCGDETRCSLMAARSRRGSFWCPV